MSRLTDLIAEAKSKDSQLGTDLEREFKVLSSRRAFGLNLSVTVPRRFDCHKGLSSFKASPNMQKSIVACIDGLRLLRKLETYCGYWI